MIFMFVIGLSIGNIAFANPGTLVYVDPEEVSCLVPCESFDVNITIAEVVDLFSWAAKVRFDGNVLKVTSVTEGPFLKGQPGGTFFIKKIYSNYVDVACVTLGAYPGVTGSGVLMTITFHVEDAGHSAIDIDDDILLDSTLTTIAHDTADGYFDSCAKANLVKKSAWPDKHHFDISKHGENQTLWGKAKNLGPIDLYVKVMFDVVRDDGDVATVETDVVTLVPDQEMDLSTKFGPLTNLDTGRYHASASCWYSSSGTYWTQGVKIKAFSFAVVP